MFDYSRPTRNSSNEVVLHLTPNQQAAPPVPFELQGQVSGYFFCDLNEEEVQHVKTAGRYSKPVLERAWLHLNDHSDKPRPLLRSPSAFSLL
ncbi:uncharacterized protein BT62DRAFT_647600 [Guyanagaster necrorhizus]|uniref:Uncharacterized protein n=1 Tax=Guyanagaster necrorhizus TaxID=856835 RepID=A0A9P7VFK8_9AGAR|nr:uncharacterized protein BT62DRAFT_647600 [Guyanagaster necrorhizus MCA 3950]KAG7440041.1 hypothetical protein BT62DRAFT_647600 [Guyanagaster necrorhizus MCA 3950]